MGAEVCAPVQAKGARWNLQRQRPPAVPLLLRPPPPPGARSLRTDPSWARSRPIPHASKPVHHLVSQLRTFGSTPLPVPLSGRVLRMAKAAVDLSAFTWRHLFRFAECLIVVRIRSVPRPPLGGRPLPHIACSAFRAMNSNALVGLVLKNPEIHAQPPLSSPCQNDANRNKSDRPHATAKSSDTVMASS
jgi:hypothetical protein